jgi:hypothetical protein
VNGPSIIERSRVPLTSGPLPREPYHDAKRATPDAAERTVGAAAEEARRLAVEAITALTASVEVDGYKLVASGVVLGGGRPGITLARALSTHAAMHGAEGWLFREALLAATHSCGLIAVGVAENELPRRTAAVLGTSEVEVSALIQQIGRDRGAPWGRDQKVAAMAALVALSAASERAPASA